MADKPSYFQGLSQPAPLELTICEFLRRIAASHDQRPAIISCHQNIRYTYGELLDCVERVALGLIALGVQPRDRVGICAPNGFEWIVSQYAAAAIGAVLVGINPAYRRHEFDHILGHAGISVLIARSLDIAPSRDRYPQLRYIVHLDPSAAGLRWAGLLTPPATASCEELRKRESDCRPSDPSQIIFTSGTAGVPKGVIQSHRALLNCGLFIGEQLGLGPQDRICLPVPLYHVFGCALGTMAALTHASAVVLPSGSFDPQTCLHAIEAEQCTALYGVPTMFHAQLDHRSFAGTRLDSLRTGIMAGAPCPVELMRRVVDKMHLPELTISYGMTECVAALHTSRHETIDRRATTVGAALPHVECRIVDPSGATVARGIPGELCIRGYGLMLGYWNDEPATRAAIDSDGWLHTGDVAVMASDGFVSVTGRLKDMIIRAGEKVFPGEVEGVLSAHPKVAEAYVTGVSDEEYGEEVCAWIKLLPGQDASAEEIRRYCRNRIAAFKIPRYVRFVKEFPVTATGKVQRYRMREVGAPSDG